RVPLLLGHVDEHPVAQDAGVVDEDVEAAKALHGRVDQALGTLPVGHVVAVGDSLAARGADLFDHLAGGTGRRTAAVDLGSQVVDDDLGALAGILQGVAPADAATGAGDDDDAAVTDSHQSVSL